MAIKIVILTVCVFGFLQFARAQKHKDQNIIITIDGNDRVQIIHNFGASGCWFSEPIGKYWPSPKREHIAELLFSRELDNAGNPRGIGLSAWRFNIGGGTAEQGDGSGIKDVNHRVECFLNSNGTYDWSKQPGYRWFLTKAKEYGVENLVAFSNTPPIQFTQNGLGYKTSKDGFANLKPAKYAAYADFLTEVVKHFDKEGLHFNYISPVNEPQWDWAGKFGEAKQEGSPWTNEEIYNVIKPLDSFLTAKKLKTKILATEAGMLAFLYDNKTAASRQIQRFFADTSHLNFRNLTCVPPIIDGHSYFTDSNDSSLVSVRKHVADTAKKYGVEFWQSEYSMLGDGYKEGSKIKRSAMDCALFLAKVIHNDLVAGNASAWQYWNAYEPGKADFDTRYYLIALQPDPDFKNGSYAETKNLWALGHYSLFIRPGMQRLQVQRSDNLNDIEAAQKTMISAYKDDNGRMVIVAINYTTKEQSISIKVKNFKPIKTVRAYVTTAAKDENMKASLARSIDSSIALPSRSISTIVMN
ncbi:glycoside hydrolase [Segetibacter koreensis]|uniref:glycoside hydrolase n=1 Tax=Segetibacter koreensis TaxID=398037 RepID=UPI00035FDF6D|nr:glycoside hydrolase [Segetibacter koreensis]